MARQDPEKPKEQKEQPTKEGTEKPKPPIKFDDWAAI